MPNKKSKKEYSEGRWSKKNLRKKRHFYEGLIGITETSMAVSEVAGQRDRKRGLRV